MTPTPTRILQRDLTAADFEVLEFERGWWKSQGRREAVVRERFARSLTQHLRLAHALLDHPQAEEYDAQLVNVLRQRRDRRLQKRRQEQVQLQERDR